VADNYVKRKKYDGLALGEDGQVILKVVGAQASDLIEIDPIDEAAVKNGGGTESSNKTQRAKA